MPDNSTRSESHAIPDGSETALGRAFAADVAAHRGQVGVLLLEHGRDAFVARAGLAQLAERSIDVQYYMFHHDTVGNLLIHELLQAADRNVRVRLLIDDMYGSDGEDDWVALDAHPHIEVRFFNPFVRGTSRYLVSPYFVPGQRATDALCKLSREGVRVRILTNSLASNDVAAVHAGYSKYRKPLLRCGVELFELDEELRAKERRAFSWLPGLSKSSLHAKTMAFDRETLFVGSFNFDQRSLYINNEVGLLFEEQGAASRSTKKFDQHIEDVAFQVMLEVDDNGEERLRWVSRKDGEKRTFDSEPYAGAGLRAAVAVLRFLPIESEL